MHIVYVPLGPLLLIMLLTYNGFLCSTPQKQSCNATAAAPVKVSDTPKKIQTETKSYVQPSNVQILLLVSKPYYDSYSYFST